MRQYLASENKRMERERERERGGEQEVVKKEGRSEEIGK